MFLIEFYVLFNVLPASWVNNNINEINLESFADGVYILRLESLEKTIDFKLIKN